MITEATKNGGTPHRSYGGHGVEPKTRRAELHAVVEDSPEGRNFVAMAKQLGPRFAARAASVDENELFVADNYVDLKNHGLVAAGVPQKLGGGGASYPKSSKMLRELGRHYGATEITGKTRQSPYSDVDESRYYADRHTQ